MIDDVGFGGIWKETELQGESPGDAEKHHDSLDNASGGEGKNAGHNVSW